MEQKIKVLQLISSAGFFGAEKVILSLAKRCNTMGINCTVGIFHNRHSPNLEIARKASEQNIETVIFDCKGKFDIHLIRKLRCFLREREISVVHSHGYKTNFYALFCALNTGVKKVATCHNWVGESKKMILYKRLDQLLLTYFDTVVAVSRSLQKEMVKNMIPEKKIKIIPNGIEINEYCSYRDTFALKDSFGITQDECVIGTVGRLTEEKGHIFLLNAFAQIVSEIPKVKLIIVGDGPLRESLTRMAANLHINENVIFCGKRDDISSLLRIMDVFVLPSLTEAMPLALLEAMASERPVVASSVGEIPYMVENGVSGLLVHPADTAQLKLAIIRLLKDRKFASMLAHECAKTVSERYTAERMARDYFRCYNS